MEYSVIVLCAGSGTRTGLAYNKILYTIKGKTLFEYTVQLFLQDIQCKQVIVVTKEEEQRILEELVKDDRIMYVFGGKERQDSVYLGLQQVTYEYVMIHDGARPFVSLTEIQALKACLQQHQACLLMVPCKDTIKEVHKGKVIRTIPRETIMQAQTPQAFQTRLITRAHSYAREHQILATDDASLVEMCTEEEVHVVIGSYENYKVTTREDL